MAACSEGAGRVIAIKYALLVAAGAMVVLLTLSLVGCSEHSIKHLPDGQELIVLTRNAPSTWYEGREGLVGPEYDLITSFAEHHGVSVRFEVMDSVDDILEAIRHGNVHMAAAGITRTQLRQDSGYHFGPSYQQVEQLVVCRRANGKIPKTPADLVGKKLAVIEGSSYEETFQGFKQKHSELQWTSVPDVGSEHLLERVWRKQIDCTVADSNIVSINRRYYPELVIAFPVSEKQPLAWVLAPKWGGLYGDIEVWLEGIKRSGELARVMERYYGHVQLYDYVDTRQYKRRIASRLPKFRGFFERAAKKNGLSWTLLAAQGYQESHWDPLARSPTGVRGIMMLTRTTAESLGVTDRLDPEQSIHGGAKYLRKMIKRIPQEVVDEDRLWYALAAYNVGYGHLKDARTLATRLKKDPNRWVDLKTVLPLLSNKQYYKALRHGYARGTEPVRYVQRIRGYRQILEQQLRK